ncbi:MAG: hypothetical protein R3321_10850 [Nitrososphaeraceae archaeon]|nr:hypothetical protein [Nitrososphaeraceae archaeon]
MGLKTRQYSAHLFYIVFLVFLLYVQQTDLTTFGQIQSLGDKIHTNVTIENKDIIPSDQQKLSIKVVDPNTENPLESAYVDLIVQDPRNVTTEIFSGLTDENGLYTHTWNINKNAETGKYTINLDIIVVGYQPLAKSETFTVISGNTTENSTNPGI